MVIDTEPDPPTEEIMMAPGNINTDKSIPTRITEKDCNKLSIKVTVCQVPTTGTEHVTKELLDKLPVSQYRDYNNGMSVDLDNTINYWPNYHPKPLTNYEHRIVIPPFPKIKLPKKKLIYSHPSKSFGFKLVFHCVWKQ